VVKSFCSPEKTHSSRRNDLKKLECFSVTNPGGKRWLVRIPAFLAGDFGE
jgi:hypothetical protein